MAQNSKTVELKNRFAKTLKSRTFLAWLMMPSQAIYAQETPEETNGFAGLL
jgi:hypothetical protein